MIKYRVLNSKDNDSVIGYAVKTNEGYKVKILENKEIYHLIYNYFERVFTVYKNSFTNRLVREVGQAWNPRDDEFHIEIELGEGKKAYIDIFAKPYEPEAKKEVVAA